MENPSRFSHCKSLTNDNFFINISPRSIYSLIRIKVVVIVIHPPCRVPFPFNPMFFNQKINLFLFAFHSRERVREGSIQSSFSQNTLAKYCLYCYEIIYTFTTTCPILLGWRESVFAPKDYNRLNWEKINFCVLHTFSSIHTRDVNVFL